MLAVLGLLAAVGCGPRSEVPKDPGTPLSVTVALSTNTIHVGSLVRATVHVWHAAGAKVELPEPGRGHEIVTRDRRVENIPGAAGRERTEYVYRLTSFDFGDHVVFTGAVRCVAAGGAAVEQPMPEAKLSVEPMLRDRGGKLRDVKGLADWPAVVPRWVWVFPLVAVLALAVALAIILLSRRVKRVFFPPPPMPLPHEVALAALHELAGRRLIEEGKAEPFYVGLSHIVRRYLEERFGLRAPERTTEEFFREAVTSHRLEVPHQLLTREFLEQCDLVKFARYQPDEPMMRGAYQSAERLVLETVPPPPVPDAGAAGGRPPAPGGAP